LTKQYLQLEAIKPVRQQVVKSSKIDPIN